MKQFLITYRLKDGMEQQRREEIDAFVAAIDADPVLRGNLSYRSLKVSGRPEYYHFAEAADEATVKALQSREFFSRYTEQTERSADGEVEVSPLEVIAETAG
jgi:quinol monooxygenase YgiN